MWDWWETHFHPEVLTRLANRCIDQMKILRSCISWMCLAERFPAVSRKNRERFVPVMNVALWQVTSPPHTLPERHNLFPPEGGRRISAGDRFIGVHVKQNTLKSLLKASEIELPFISSWNPVKYFIRFICGLDWRPGSLDFVENKWQRVYCLMSPGRCNVGRFWCWRALALALAFDQIRDV